MSLLDKLKSLLGLGSSPRRPEGQRDVGVTVEHEPGDAGPRVETATAVKGTDVTDESEGERVTDQMESEPETPPESEPGRADESGVEIPDAEELGSEGESGEARGEEGTVDIPDAEELARGEEAGETTEREAEAGETTAEPEGPAAETGEPEPEAADEPTDTIKGIGATYADRLADADVETVGDLAAADPADLAEEADVSESRLQRWVKRARER